MTQPLPRYSQRPFPAYAYLPGRDPHPTRDTDGHSYGTDTPELEHFDPERWRDCEEYLYAIDLINHGYYWEAHESLEAIWLAAGQRRTQTGLFVQGLLQIGVGMLKLRQGQRTAARGLWSAGRDKIRRQLARQSYLGINMAWLDQTVDELLQGNTTTLPVILLEGIQPI